MALDPLRAALALLIVLNVSRIHQHFGWMAQLRPAMLLVGLAVLYAVLNRKALNADGLLQTREARLIGGLILLACIGAPFGLSLGGSGRYIIESYSKVVIAALLLIAAMRSARDLYTFVWAYVIGCGILSWFGVFVFGLSGAAGSAVIRLNDLYTYDANDIGVVLLVGLALTMLVLQTSRRAGKVVAIAILIGIGVTLARSGSRGAFVGFAGTAAALLVMLTTVPVWKRAAFVAVAVVSLAVAAPPGYWDQMRTLLDLKNDYNATTIDGRKELTKRGISYMLAYPVFGLGINNFWRAECIVPLSAKVRLHRSGTGIRCTPPHNTHVEVGAELGIPGLLVFWTLILGGIRRGLRLRRKLPRAWMTGDQEQRFLYLSTMYVPVAMVAFFITSTFVTFAWIDIVYLVAAMLAGLGIAVKHRLAREDPAAVPVPARPMIVGPRRRTGYGATVPLPR